MVKTLVLPLRLLILSGDAQCVGFSAGKLVCTFTWIGCSRCCGNPGLSLAPSLAPCLSLSLWSCGHGLCPALSPSLAPSPFRGHVAPSLAPSLSPAPSFLSRTQAVPFPACPFPPPASAEQSTNRLSTLQKHLSKHMPLICYRTFPNTYDCGSITKTCTVGTISATLVSSGLKTQEENGYILRDTAAHICNFQQVRYNLASV